MRRNFWGALRNVTISVTSSLASSMPATSRKVTWLCSFMCTLALERPNCMTPEPPTLRIWRMSSHQKKTIRSNQGRKLMRPWRKELPLSLYWILPWAARSFSSQSFIISRLSVLVRPVPV